jgi:hypothetical protein
MVKSPWREADHTIPSSAEVKNMWLYAYAHFIPAFDAVFN